ncbi:MAG TPA: VOC family protein [Thermoplasmata archaeon]|nr:VOC family protein [Thermoplasmata archaeon]
MYLSYVGLRVRDLPRSVRFYTEVFGLVPVQPEELSRMDPTATGAILLRDPNSGARLELNYYPPGTPYAVPYATGEELDHLGFRVDDLDSTLERLATLGCAPEKMEHYSGPILTTPHYRMSYVRDPDGILLEIWDAPGPRTYAADRY